MVTFRQKIEPIEAIYDYGIGFLGNKALIFPLNDETINTLVPTADILGNYRLGVLLNIENKSVFHVVYIGRSDHNLRKRLKDHIGEFGKNIYFTYKVQECRQDTYHQECKDYHHFLLDDKNNRSDLLNKDHPAQPENTDFHCPICGFPCNK